MAIIYSYPLNKNILPTDIIVGTTTATVSGTGRPKNQTKSFQVIDLAGYINSFNTLDTVLHNGNTSLLDAKIGELGLYDPTEQDYAKLNINDSEFNFYNATGSIISVLTKDTLSLYANSYIGNLLVPNTITANRSYVFPNQSGTVALLSDIPSVTGFVPYTGATTTVNLGSQNIFANEMLANELFLFDASYATYGNVFLQAEGFYVKNNATTVLANINPGEMALLGFGPGGDWQAKFTYSTLSANRTYALPNASGTIALASDIPIVTGFVPYTGATGAVNLGAYNLTVNTISVGKGAGTGINNTAIGNSVLISNTTGTYNVAIGFEALKVNTTGGTNIAIGRGALQANTTSGGNIALGYNSMFSNTTGGNNVSIGNGVMTGNTTGSGNVAIGYNTLTVQGTVSNTVAIGQGALQFNNSGLLNTAVGFASMTANTFGSNNTALGANALQNNNTGSDNTALGMYVLLNNTGGTGTANTGVGKESLRFNTTGGANTGVGKFSLYSNTTGDQNTATGASALSSITTGSFNVGVGVNSMSNSTTAYNNVAVGYNSIQGTFGASNTGYNNVGIGYYGLRNNTSGFENVGIGYNSLLLNPTDNNSIVIGSGATGLGSNTVTLGNTSITTTRLRGNVQGGSFVKDGGTASQYLMADGTTTTAIKSTYMMTGVFTNMFGGDPGGNSKDVLEWVASTPNSSHSSVLPILQNCRITAAGFKWISSTPIGTINPGDSWTVQVFKMTNPLTDSTTADGNFTFLGNLNITLTSANTGTTPGVFSSGLNVVLNAGDIIRIAGIETGTIAVSTEEAQLTVLFEVI